MSSLLHGVSLGLISLVLWLLLSGHGEPLLLILGILSTGLVVFIARRMDLGDREGHPIHLTWRAILYWPWLIKEIAVSNWDVAKILVRRRMPISPTTLCINAGQRSELGHVIFGNSITLTPGTVTVAMDNGELSVHALTREAAEALAGGAMDDRVSAMTGDLRTNQGSDGRNPDRRAPS